MGKDDCGCNKRRKTLNEILPYKQESNPNIKELKEINGNYEVLQEIHCTLPEIGKTVLNKGTILTVNKNHPLYKDIPFYFKKNIIKKL